MRRIVHTGRLYVPYALMDGLQPEAIKDLCTHTNPAFFEKKRLKLATWNEPPELRTWLDHGVALSVPRGRAAEVIALLGLPVRDHRVTAEAPVKFSPARAADERYAFQAEAVEVCLRETCGVVRLPTGSGKTSTGALAIARSGMCSLVLVDNLELMREWKDRICSELESSDGSPMRQHVGCYGGGKHEVRTITVAVMQALNALPSDKLYRFFRHFGMVLYDEVQTGAAPTYMRLADQAPAKCLIGLSADHRRLDGKHFLIEDVFGPVIYEKKKRELQGAGIVVPVTVTLFRTEFAAPWYRGMSPIQKKRATVRLISEMVADDDRTAACAEVAATAARDGKLVLVLSERVEHCRRIVQLLDGLGLRFGLLIGGDGRALAQSVEGMRSRALNGGVGTLKAVGKGVNIPAADFGVLCTPIGSKQPFGQACGRLSRPGKDKAELWVAWDWRVYGDSFVRRIRGFHGEVSIRTERGMIDAKHYMKGARAPTR